MKLVSDDRSSSSRTFPQRVLRKVYRSTTFLLPIELRRLVLFRRAHGFWPDLAHPKTFSEKVQWRILNDHRPELGWTCDKELMKRRVVALDASIRTVPTLWYGEDLADLERVQFPEQWVLKPNRQSSGRVLFGKGQPDFGRVASIVESWLKPEAREIAWLGEWAYKQARSGVLLEPKIEGIHPDAAPADYKIFVFDGVPRLVQVHLNRGDDHQQFHLTTDWEHYGISTAKTPDGDFLPPKPASLTEMLDQAKNIARGLDFIRVDFYDDRGEAVFGEVTPYPAGGLRQYHPATADMSLGEHWVLPNLPSR